MHDHAQARRPIENMIANGDLEGLLRLAETLHGHLCPFVSLGVKAGQYAMAHLQRHNTGMEEIVAIVECNNCFTDGVQIVTGCTFGNNALIFRDLGKTAVTVAVRDSGEAIRLVVTPDYRGAAIGPLPQCGAPLSQSSDGTAGDAGRRTSPLAYVVGPGPAGVICAPGGAVPDPAPAGGGSGLCPDLRDQDLQQLRGGSDGAAPGGGKWPGAVPDLCRKGFLSAYRPGNRDRRGVKAGP